MPKRKPTGNFMNLKRHHKLLIACAILFGIAWAVWTFYLLPLSELPTPG